MLAHLTSLLLLAFAVSLDGFGVGITYGLRKIRIPISSVAIIAGCSGVIILIAMLVGGFIARWLSPEGAKSIGAFILMGIGLWAIIQFIRNRKHQAEEENSSREASALEALESPATATIKDSRSVLTLEIRRLGIVVQILRTPSAADVDRSGIITSGEAFLLGFALSLDAFGAGIGAALIGFPPALTAVLIATASGAFLWSGMRVGFLVAGVKWIHRLTVLPGIILILMGIFKLL